MQMTRIADTSPARLAEAYFKAIREGNEFQAEEVAVAGVESGLTAFELALQVFAPALSRIGALWHEGKVSVAEEHHATQITFALFERLRGRTKRRPPIGHRAVVTTAEGEYHTLGARLAAEILFTDGWDVDYLGANTPVKDLVGFSQQRGASVVVLSVLLNDNLDAAAKAIGNLKSSESPPHVIVGGAAVESAASESKLKQADALVNDLRHLPIAARALVGRPAGDTLEDYLITIGLGVQEMRRRKGWSQSELAAAADLDRTYISGVERGKQNLSLGVLVRLAEALGEPIEAFLNRDGRR
jgi:methanogenic corrinoid protein MtbC1/DNA-binding XRE family transcriptional regulator